MRVTTADDLVRMMGRFRGNVDFSDSPNGFFGFVRETFEQLAREEEYAADYEEIDIPSYPSFGHKDDDYEGVVRDFYAAWNGFATAKSFAWLDMYRLSDAPDRRTRRLMEKENQKFRDDGKREFNDAVRTLIAFVRKRDPRYTPNTQTDEDKAKAQRDARKAQAARARAAQIAKLEQETQAVPDWATARPADELEEGSEEEIEEEHYECVACNKTFKSERQWEAHEKSKKHQKAIRELKRRMQKDNAHLNLDEDALSSGVITPANDELGADAVVSDVDDDSLHDLVEKTDELQLKDRSSGEEETEAAPKDAVTETTASELGASPEVASIVDEDDDDDEYTSRSEIEARLAGFAKTAASTVPAEGLDTKAADLINPEPDASQEPKLGAAAKKRAKKAAKQVEVETSDEPGKCAGCEVAFPSKTQLHQHLKKHPKHAALKNVDAGGGGKRGKKR
jgi:DnaJ family protein A protein 5